MYSLFPAAIAILFLGYGIYVLRRAGRTRVSLSFFLLCLTTFAWQFTWAILFQVQEPEVIGFLVRVGYLFILFLPTTLYHFLVEITETRTERRGVRLSYGMAAALALVLFPTDLFVSGWYEYFFGPYPRAGILHPLHVVQTCVVVLRGLYITWNAQAAAAPRLRIRLRYCVASLLIYLVAAVDYLCNYGLEFYPPGVFFISVSLGLLAVATVKHQLMDVSLALTHGLARLIAMLFFGLVYTALYLVIETRMPGRDSWVDLGLGLAFVILVGEGFVPVRTFIQGVPERLMRGAARRRPAGAALQAVSQALGSHISLADMMRDLEQVLQRHSRLGQLHLFVRDDFVEPGERPRGEFLPWDVARGVTLRQPALAPDHPLIDALARGAPVQHESELAPQARQLLARCQALSALAVHQGDRLVAVLLVGGRDGIRRYTHEDLDLIEFLPGQLSLGLDKVHAYTQLSHGLDKAQKTASLMALMNEYQHELKAPISIMHMYAQADLEVPVLREEVLVQCERLLGLLERMLHVLQDNRVREERLLDINDVVDAALKLFPVPGLRMEKELQPGMPRILGDQDDLLILVVNMLKNAREASDPRRRNVIRIRTRHLPDLNAIQLLVEDRGVGMSTDQLRRLWLPATSGKDGGTGLGLKVMQRIVDEHEGEVKVSSEIGAGSRFEVRLPVAAERPRVGERLHG